MNFSRPWFSEIKLQIKRTKVSLKLPLINFKCRCRMHFTYQRGNKWDMWGLRSPLFLPKINKLFFYFPGLTTFMLCTWKLEPSCCKKCQKSSNQETGLRNMGRLKVLNDTKLILNYQRVTYSHLWLIHYHSEPSDVPYSQN